MNAQVVWKASVEALIPSPRHGQIVRALWRRWLRLRLCLWDRRRLHQLRLDRVAGISLVILPGVFHPGLFRSGAFFADVLTPRLIPPGSDVLDMGTGTGIGAIVAARWARRVVAVDIDRTAIRCARINVLLHNLEDRIDVRGGDLFTPVRGEQFDVVLFNPPYFRGEPQNPLERALRAETVLERFTDALPRHLRPGGWALVAFSTAGAIASMLKAFLERGWRAEVVATRDLINEVLVIYRFTHPSGRTT